MKMLRTEMEEISEEQQKIKEGQRQVREKFEAIEWECDQLRKETNQIMQQSASTQIRLAFMFQILKARENQDFEKAAQLTNALRYFSQFSLTEPILVKPLNSSSYDPIANIILHFHFMLITASS